jgi:hypothetical protein
MTGITISIGISKDHLDALTLEPDLRQTLANRAVTIEGSAIAEIEGGGCSADRWPPVALCRTFHCHQGHAS